MKLDGNNKAASYLQSEHAVQVMTPALFLNARRVSPLENVGLMVIPICFLFLASIFLHAKGPYWLGTSSDPDYPYLFNALLIDQGQPPEHIDHPGTPVQLWVAGALKITHFAVGRGSLVNDVLTRPEFYLKVANWTFLAALAAALWARVTPSGASRAATGPPFLCKPLPCSVQRFSTKWNASSRNHYLQSASCSSLPPPCSHYGPNHPNAYGRRCCSESCAASPWP